MYLSRHALIAASLFASTSAALAAPPPNWTTTVILTPTGSHVRGNPAAPLKVTAYVSYTCPHCAAFEREADAPLKRDFVGTGNVSFEIKHFLRDPIDATVAQLTNCGPKEKFFGNHAAFMYGQDRWLAPLATATDAQRQRWSGGDHVAQRKAIAADFHLYDIMAKRGYTRPQLDRCLADEVLARRIAAQTVEAVKLGFEGTPSFTLNGSPLFGTNSWPTLVVQLRARM